MCGQAVQKNAKSLFNQAEGAVQIVVEDKWREYELTIIPRSIPYKRKADLVEMADSEIRKIWMSTRLPQ